MVQGTLALSNRITVFGAVALDFDDTQHISSLTSILEDAI
jgi:hypothetical protein